MQDAGVNVIFGVEGLKVHSKITHIKMKKGPDIACISTGNFHEGNARMYTDCMLMTAAPRIVKDVHSVSISSNVLTIQSSSRNCLFRQTK